MRVIQRMQWNTSLSGTKKTTCFFNTSDFYPNWSTSVFFVKRRFSQTFQYDFTLTLVTSYKVPIAAPIRKDLALHQIPQIVYWVGRRSLSTFPNCISRLCFFTTQKYARSSELDDFLQSSGWKYNIFELPVPWFSWFLFFFCVCVCGAPQQESSVKPPTHFTISHRDATVEQPQNRVRKTTKKTEKKQIRGWIFC